MRNKELAKRRIEKMEIQINKIKSSLSVGDIPTGLNLMLELKEILNDLGDIIEREN